MNPYWMAINVGNSLSDCLGCVFLAVNHETVRQGLTTNMRADSWTMFAAPLTAVYCAYLIHELIACDIEALSLIACSYGISCIGLCAFCYVKGVSQLRGFGCGGYLMETVSNEAFRTLWTELVVSAHSTCGSTANF